MEEIIKSCIEPRKTALMSTYDIKDQGALKNIEDYFKKLEEFAKDCKNQMDFETKFASSPLAQEYTDLFVMVSKIADGTINVEEKSYAEELSDELKDDAIMFARRKAHQKAYDTARDIPILGEAMTAKQHFDFFSRFRKKDK
ncbi:MAG: hypothetical protein IJ568_06490 [Bacilli bacterium]|nr:hypothetical protein [Bacilli bacterium]